jgi:hypothetical protein
MSLDLFRSDGYAHAIEFTAKFNLTAQARGGESLSGCAVEHVVLEVACFAYLISESFIDIDVARCTRTRAAALSNDSPNTIFDREVHHRITVATFEGSFSSVWGDVRNARHDVLS